jgi:glycosyltransferase involved in cell wall biosynthesis
MRAPTLIIVAAYNEADRIRATLDALALAFPQRPVWVADDGSTDATPQIAREAGARVVRSERVIGKGAAVTLAAREAVDAAPGAAQAGGESVFLLCDGDLGESAARLAAIVDAVARGEADVAVAAFARRVGGGFGVAVGFVRWAIRRRCGFDATAPVSGQRALNERALRDVLPFARDFGMEIGITIDAVRAGHRVREIELDLEHRATGRTLGGFAHRARQLVDFARVYLARGPLGSRAR